MKQKIEALAYWLLVVAVVLLCLCPVISIATGVVVGANVLGVALVSLFGSMTVISFFN